MSAIRVNFYPTPKFRGRTVGKTKASGIHLSTQELLTSLLLKDSKLKSDDGKPVDKITQLTSPEPLFNFSKAAISAEDQSAHCPSHPQDRLQ
ncbi:hypothetical protein chiPu_0032388 [Chiloscyllium punctatum]|uniref:Uncharacterized protein n=1 Tax=Chiloscyllium punctatum TaxID=137246 RepID=A0A401TZQ1_CHIPU|nr:hypothetical protein [Chiloscyllium punctatum]